MSIDDSARFAGGTSILLKSRAKRKQNVVSEGKKQLDMIRKCREAAEKAVEELDRALKDNGRSEKEEITALWFAFQRIGMDLLGEMASGSAPLSFPEHDTDKTKMFIADWSRGAGRGMEAARLSFALRQVNQAVLHLAFSASYSICLVRSDGPGGGAPKYLWKADAEHACVLALMAGKWLDGSPIADSSSDLLKWIADTGDREIASVRDREMAYLELHLAGRDWGIKLADPDGMTHGRVMTKASWDFRKTGMMWVFPGLISVYVNQLTRADYSAFLIQAGRREQLLRWSRELVGRLEELERLQSDENAEHERRAVEAWPPLLSDAIDSLQVNAVEEALAWGDDVNKQDERGWPPLLRAAARGAVEIAVLLKGRGANPRARRGGWTALMWATAAGSRELVALFLPDGASDWEAKHRRDCRAVRNAAIAMLIFAAVASAFGVSMRIWPKEPAPPFFGGCFLLAFLVCLSVFVWALFRCRKTARMEAAFAEMVPADGGIQRECGTPSSVTRAKEQPVGPAQELKPSPAPPHAPARGSSSGRADPTLERTRMLVAGCRAALTYLETCGDLAPEKYAEAFRRWNGEVPPNIRQLWAGADYILSEGERPGGKEALRYVLLKNIREGMDVYMKILTGLPSVGAEHMDAAGKQAAREQMIAAGHEALKNLEREASSFQGALQYLKTCGELTFEKYVEARRRIGDLRPAIRSEWEKARNVPPDGQVPGGAESLRFKMCAQLRDGIAQFEKQIAKHRDELDALASRVGVGRP